MVMMKIVLCLILCSVPAALGKTALACTGEPINLLCAPGEEMTIEDVMYGRQVPYSQKCYRNNCAEDTSCSLDQATDRVRSLCSGQHECSFSGYSLGPDPCPGTDKYVEVQYTCMREMPVALACQYQDVEPSCSTGKIKILDVMYGRQNTETCPHSAMEDTNCRSENAVEAVKDLCDGEESCSANASIDPDPCYGTNKYLEVTYGCVN